MIRTFAALAAVLTVGAVQAADMNMDMSGHDHHMMMGDHSMHMAAQSPAVLGAISVRCSGAPRADLPA